MTRRCSSLSTERKSIKPLLKLRMILILLPVLVNKEQQTISFSIEHSRDDDMFALVVHDRGTKFTDGLLAPINDTPCTVKCFHQFYGAIKPARIYTDNAKELIASCDQLGWSHDTSTPHRPQSNGVSERHVRKAKEGTRSCLVQSGLFPLCWNYAMRHFFFFLYITLCPR